MKDKRDELQVCKCGELLVAHEIEIHGEFIEIAGYCDNEECIRFNLLVV